MDFDSDFFFGGAVVSATVDASGKVVFGGGGGLIVRVGIAFALAVGFGFSEDVCDVVLGAGVLFGVGVGDGFGVMLTTPLASGFSTFVLFCAVSRVGVCRRASRSSAS